MSTGSASLNANLAKTESNSGRNENAEQESVLALGYEYRPVARQAPTARAS